MVKKLNITCDEATTICDKSQYSEASLVEKIKLSWHLFLCKICTNYSKQNSLMSRLFHLKAAECKAKNACMSTSDKEALKKEFEKIKG